MFKPGEDIPDDELLKHYEMVEKHSHDLDEDDPHRCIFCEKYEQWLSDSNKERPCNKCEVMNGEERT